MTMDLERIALQSSSMVLSPQQSNTIYALQNNNILDLFNTCLQTIKAARDIKRVVYAMAIVQTYVHVEVEDHSSTNLFINSMKFHKEVDSMPTFIMHLFSMREELKKTGEKKFADLLNEQFIEIPRILLNPKVFSKEKRLVLISNFLKHICFESWFSYIIERIDAHNNFSCLCLLKLLFNYDEMLNFLETRNPKNLVHDLLKLFTSKLKAWKSAHESGNDYIDLMVCFSYFLTTCSHAHDALFENQSLRSAVSYFLQMICAHQSQYICMDRPSHRNNSNNLLVFSQARASCALFRLYCSLFDSKGIFIKMIEEIFCTFETRLQFVDHLRMLQSNPFLNLDYSFSVNSADILQFKLFFDAIRKLKFPVQDSVISFIDGDQKINESVSCDQNDTAKSEGFSIFSQPACKIPLNPKLRAVFIGESKGWRLMAMDVIETGTLLCDFLGQFCELDSYPDTERETSQGFLYLIEKYYLLDLPNEGNFSRYINHSHEPNCKFIVRKENGMSRLFLISQVRISSGSEITVNYKDYVIGNPQTICLCGAKSCSGRIPFVSWQDLYCKKKLAKQNMYKPKPLSIDCSRIRVFTRPCGQNVLKLSLKSAFSKFSGAKIKNGPSVANANDLPLAFCNSRGYFSRQCMHFAIAAGVKLHKEYQKSQSAMKHNIVQNPNVSSSNNPRSQSAQMNANSVHHPSPMLNHVHPHGNYDPSIQFIPTQVPNRSPWIYDAAGRNISSQLPQNSSLIRNQMAVYPSYEPMPPPAYPPSQLPHIYPYQSETLPAPYYSRYTNDQMR